MSELSPRGRALFEAGRRSLLPSTADRERIHSRLSERLGRGEPQRPDATTASAGAKGLGWPGLTALAVGLAVAGGGVFELVRSRGHEPVPPATVSAPSTSALEEPSVPAPVLAPAAPPGADSAVATVEPSRAGGRAAASAQANDRLAEEVAILSQAERDLHAGQYRDALRLLDEHRRKFPNGTLAQERIAARVQALCGLGRVTEAQAELARLTRLSPKSPHGGPAKQACATDGSAND